MGPFPMDTGLSEGLLCCGASCQEEGRKFLSASFPEEGGDHLEYLGLKGALGKIKVATFRLGMPWRLSPYFLLHTPPRPRADLVWKGVFAVGAEVAVYKWTLGCDGDSRKQLGGGGSRGRNGWCYG